MSKIAFFSGYHLPHTGGIERYTYNLSKQLKQMGHKTIIVTSQYDRNLKNKEETDEATIYRLPIYKLFSSRYPIIMKNKKYREIIKELEKENIDSIILNTRFHLTSFIGAKFSKKNNIPACLIEHGSSHFTVYNKIFDYFGHIYEHKLTKKMKKLVKDYYGVSTQCNEWLKHFEIEAKGVFYNCIDEDEYEKYKDETKIEKNKIIISYAGRMLRDKGIYQLIEAYRILQKKYNNIELVLAGDGPILNDIKEKNGDIKITGKLNHDEVMQLLNKTDIFVHPSMSEGMPTAVLEAGLMKCAVVATPVGGTTEIICDETIGQICNLDSNDIADKIEDLILNKEKRKKLQQNIHDKVINSFTWKAATEKIINTIKYKNNTP